MVRKTINADLDERHLELVWEIEQVTGVKRPFCQARNQLLHAPTVEAFRKKWEELEDDKEGREKLAKDSAADAAIRCEVGIYVCLCGTTLTFVGSTHTNTISGPQTSRKRREIRKWCGRRHVCRSTSCFAMCGDCDC